MKKLRLLVLFLAIFYGLMEPLLSQTKEGFLIVGELKGLKDGTVLYLVHNPGPDTVCKAIAKDEKFSFKGFVPIEGEAFFIKIDTVSVKYPVQIKGIISIIGVQNKTIILNGSVKDLSIFGISIVGLQAHHDYLDYQLTCKLALENHHVDEIFNRLKNAKRYRDSIGIAIYERKYQEAQDTCLRIRLDWIDKNGNSLITPWVISILSGDINQLEARYEALTLRVKKSHEGVLLKNKIDVLNNTMIGKIAPDFKLPTHDGNYISLYEVVLKGKLTLIDFWASWCKPCRATFPYLKRIYKQYHSEGLNIIGFSVDKNELNWMSAIESDSIPWYNIRQLKGDFAQKVYGIEMVPTTYLLDNKGRIIAKNLREEELKILILQILGSGN